MLPRQLLWIPGGVSHNVILCDNVDFRAVYLDQKRFASLPESVEVFTISPLLEEVIEAMCHTPFHTNWMAGMEFHLQSLLIDKIRTAAYIPSWPVLPYDPRRA